VRSPLDTAQEFAPYEEAHGELLDMFGEGQSVKRLEGEPDDLYRDRIREAVRVRKKLERAATGMSLIPPLVEVDLPPAPPSDSVLLGSIPPKPEDNLRTMAEWAFLTEHARARDEEVVQLRAEILEHRALLKRVEIAARHRDWAEVDATIAMMKEEIR